MKTIRRSLAALELLLVFPAVLFMTALFARNLQPQQFEPARTAQFIVDWYSARTHIGLWLLLMALPMTVLIIGVTTLLRLWRRDPDFRENSRQAFQLVRTNAATLLITCATVAAAAILVIVGLHVVTD